MEPRYERNIPALSEPECKVLRSKKVFVAGCGGLGGYLIELMARAGIGSIHAVDADVFDETNLNRQLLSEEGIIGESKAIRAGLRVRKINGDVKITTDQVYLTEANALELIQGCDAVLDGLDNPESRKILARACAQANIPYIYGAIGGWIAQAGISMPGDQMMERLYPEGTRIPDKSVLSFTPALCASMQASLCVQLLVGRPVKTGTVYYFDLLNQEFEIIPMT